MVQVLVAQELGLVLLYEENIDHYIAISGDLDGFLSIMFTFIYSCLVF
jgi:hypothetical protein